MKPARVVSSFPMKMFRQIECCSERARSWKTVTIPMSRAACTE